MRNNIQLPLVGVTGVAVVCASFYLIYRYKEKLRLQAKEILQDGNDNDADQDIVAKAKLRGNAYYRENRFEDAIAEYKKSLSILETFGPLNDSDSQMKAILYTNLASSYENLCDYQSAIDCCTKATDIKPMYAKGHFRLGSIHAKLDDLPNAIEHYATALTLNPGWIPGLINQVDMLIGKLGNKFAEEEIKKVKPMVPTNNHLRQSLIREMFSDDIFASDFIDKFVGCDLPTVRKIIASIRNDELNFALEQVKLLQLNYSEKPLSNDELLILLIKSTIHLFFAKFGYALLDLNVIIDHLAERELNSIEKKLLLAAYVRRSYVHTNNGNIETALIDTDKAIAIDPERPYTHCYKGQLSIIYRNYEGACTCLKSTLDLFGDKVNDDTRKKIQIQCIVASLYALLSRGANNEAELVDLARKAYDGITEMEKIVYTGTWSSSYIEILMEIAQILHDVGSFDAAYEYLQRTLKQCNDQEISFVYPQIAVIIVEWSNEPAFQHRRKEMQNEAESLLLKTKELNRGTDAVYHFLAGFEYKRLNLQRAKEHIEDALRVEKGIGETDTILSFKIAMETAIRVRQKLNIPANEPVIEFSTYLSNLSLIFAPKFQST